MVIASITRPREMWYQLAAKHEGQFQQDVIVPAMTLSSIS